MARTVRFSQVLWILTTTWLAACGRIGFGDGANRGGPGDGGVGSGPPNDAVVSTPDATGSPTPDAPSIDAAPLGPIASVSVAGAMSTTCGGGRVAQTITIKNVGDQDLKLSNLVVSADFTSTPATTTATVAPGTSTTFTVRPRTAVVGSDVASDFGGMKLTGTFDVDTNTALSVHRDLAADIIGANIEITDLSNGDIGNLNLIIPVDPGTCPAPQSLSYQITGVSSANIQLDGGGLFVFSGFSGGTMTSNSGVTTSVTPTAGNDCTQLATIQLSGASGANVCHEAIVSVTYDFSSGSGSGSSGSGAQTCVCP